MNRLALFVSLSLLAGHGICQGTFEIQDPAQTLQEDIKKASEAAELAKEQAALKGDAVAAYYLNKSDLLGLFVGNYVHGFKEFDTTVETSDGAVSVGIYFDPNEQEKTRAEQLASKFRTQLPLMFEKTGYEWASDVDIVVTVHSRKRSAGY